MCEGCAGDVRGMCEGCAGCRDVVQVEQGTHTPLCVVVCFDYRFFGELLTDDDSGVVIMNDGDDGDNGETTMDME